MSLVQERSIVLIEDSEEDYAVFRRAMRRFHSEVKIVRYSDGEAFLDALRGKNLPAPPVVIVLDLNLPALTGQDVLREIRSDAETRGLPVIVLTTSANPKDVRESYDLNVGGYIVKQGDFEGFRDKIESLADFWLGTVHHP